MREFNPEENASASPQMIWHNRSNTVMRTHQQKGIDEEGILMGAARRRRRWRTSKSKHRRQRSSKPSAHWRREMSDDNESAEAEGIDRLLLSALKFWEVERDLIEERRAAKGW